VTALTLVTPDGAQSHRVSDSTVVFARLTTAQIDAYVATGEWTGKAGGYAVQGRAAAFVRALHGSYSGVVGLPLFETAQLLAGRCYIGAPC
jgi:septum formation protein